MTRKNYMKILMAAALLLITAACRREYAPDYDNRQSNALLDALDAMERGQDDRAAAIASARGTHAGSFNEELLAIIRKRQQMRTIGTYLDRGDFQSLRLYLEEQQRSGDASNELLLLKELPDDLQALALFCSRMPWESSAALHDALDDLQAHLPTLSEYPSFKRFHAEQLALLEKLRIREARGFREKTLSELDAAVAAARPEETRRLISRLKTKSSSDDVRAIQTVLLSGDIDGVADGELLSIALLEAWERIPPSRRSLAAETLRKRKTDTLCARTVDALDAGTPEQFEQLLCLYVKKDIIPPPALIRSCLKGHPARKLRSDAVLPGYADTLAFIVQFANIDPKEHP